MGVVSLAECAHLLACPGCRSPLASYNGAYECRNTSCRLSRNPFPMIAGVWPALVDFDNSVLALPELMQSRGASAIRRDYAQRSKLRAALGRMLNPSNIVAERIVRRLLSMLRERPAQATFRQPLVLVIGGATIGSGLEELYTDDISVLSFDIYQSAYTQLIADAHQIPLQNASVDAVVIQAVLEHVLEPWTVCREIHRVLRPGGFVFADTPFLQQVHEGPYDFTRFTESGHRYLFRDFEEIESGVGAGLGSQLLWSIDYFVRGIFRSRELGLSARLLMSWLARLDGFAGKEFSVDGACSVYFLGTRSETPIGPKDIVSRYRGAQKPPQRR